MLLNYINIAWKVLLRHPVYTFITMFGIVFTLTVLIVLASFIDHVIGAHYPEYKRERTLYLQQVTLKGSLGETISAGPVSLQFLQKYVLTLKKPEKIGFTTIGSNANAYINENRIVVKIKHTNAEFWEVAEYNFLEGKPFDEQSITNSDNVAVISDDLKQKYFGTTTEPVTGKSIEVDSRRYRVIGVVQGVPITRGYTVGDMFIPYTASNLNMQSTGFMGEYVALLLAYSEGDLSTVETELQQSISRIPVPQEALGAKIHTIETQASSYLKIWLTSGVFGQRENENFAYSALTVIILLFMSLPAINLINLNTSRMMERASEIAVRKAFGAPIRTLVWQFTVENLFVTFIGGVVALTISSLIIYMINQSGWILKADLTINFFVFTASMLATFIFGLMSGILPALRMSKLSIVDALKNA